MRSGWITRDSFSGIKGALKDRPSTKGASFVACSRRDHSPRGNASLTREIHDVRKPTETSHEETSVFDAHSDGCRRDAILRANRPWSWLPVQPHLAERND